MLVNLLSIGALGGQGRLCEPEWWDRFRNVHASAKSLLFIADGYSVLQVSHFTRNKERPYFDLPKHTHLLELRQLLWRQPNLI